MNTTAIILGIVILIFQGLIVYCLQKEVRELNIRLKDYHGIQYAQMRNNVLENGLLVARTVLTGLSPLVADELKKRPPIVITVTKSATTNRSDECLPVLPDSNSGNFAAIYHRIGDI